VLRRYVPATLPVVVAPHGVTPEVHVLDVALRTQATLEYRGEAFSVLHMTSSETDRKGTQQLLRAWKESKRRGTIPGRARLYVVMNPAHMSKIRWWCADLGLTDLDVPTRPGLIESQDGIAKLYGSMHAVCQPSRGEGFGLVPLEALACGVPVLATSCTGHSEYLRDGHPGVCFVEDGPLAPMDDFPGSMAPSVTVEAICSGLVRLYSNWEKTAQMAEANAARVRTEWAWEKKNAVPIRQMLQSAEQQMENQR
jgi:glycosyltransferase involved in cell wall biosynthesis